MQIYVVSRNWVQRAPGSKYAEIFDSMWGFISITTFTHWDGQYESPIPDALQNKDNVLHLCFDDATPLSQNYNGMKQRLFSKDNAQHIVHFIEKGIAEKATKLLIHCDAGVSRSGAVGSVLNDYFNKYKKLDKHEWNAFYTLRTERQLQPNPHVTAILKQALYGEDSNLT